MAYRITEECVRCGDCEWVCKNEAIVIRNATYVIDQHRCNDCLGDFESPRCAFVCRIDCCVPETVHSESREVL
jgi:ferredoxin